MLFYLLLIVIILSLVFIIMEVFDKYDEEKVVKVII